VTFGISSIMQLYGMLFTLPALFAVVAAISTPIKAPPPPRSKCLHPPANTLAFYQDDNYQGKCLVKSATTTTCISVHPFADDTWASIKVPSGVTCEAYKLPACQGANLKVTQSIPVLNNEWKDHVVSIKCQKKKK